MPSKFLLQFVTFLVLTSSLLACQTTQKTIGDPTTDVEASKTSQSENQTGSVSTVYQQAIKSSQDGDIDRAIQQFNKVIETDPASKQVFTRLGLLYIHKKQPDAAKDAFLKAIEQDKNDAVAYNHLAVIQRQQGEFKMALFNYYKAIKANPDYANAHLNLGILLDIYLQELPEALQQYEIYQRLTDNSNQQVNKWILDIKRRIKGEKGK